MIIYKESDYNEFSKRAAKIFAQAVKETPTGSFGFATGGTPMGMYEELIRQHKAGEINLSAITAFNLDEYYPISKTDPQSYAYYMAQNLFDAVGVPQENRNIPNGEAEDPLAEARLYDEKLENTPRLEMQILGIGANGHIAFNEPDGYFTSSTLYIPLTESTIEANSRFFESIEKVPKHAISMGIRPIMMAKRILLLANGAGKAEILKRALFGAITPQVPASVLQLHPDVTIVVDNDAASYLEM